MILRVLNRLIGRTDSSSDEAVNAYVEGNASQSEINLVEQMMRENPALEKDLSTQKSLLNVLGRIDRIEAPRSFAVTPEMVAAAERSESSIARFIDMFAPQRKLAMAPAVIAVIAALSVALLTIGDIAGVVEQSNDRINDSASTAASAESEYATDGEAIVTVVVGYSADSSAPQIEMAAGGGIEEPKSASGAGYGAATAVPAATAEQAAASLAPDAPPSTSLLAPAPEAATSGDAVEDVEPVQIEEQADTVVTLESDGATTARSESSDDVAPATDSVQMPATADMDGSPLLGGTADAELAAQNSSLDDGFSLPIWQIQIALAALALAAIGAWAGLRRARG